MPFTGVKRDRNKILLTNIEAVSGTEEVLTGTHYTDVDEATIEPQPTTVNRNELGAGIDRGRSLITRIGAQLTTTSAIRGSGVAGTAPKSRNLFLACAMAETIVATTSVSYAPISTPPETITAYLYEDGIRTKAVGLSGNFQLNLSTSAVNTINCTFTGQYAATAPRTDTANPSVTLPTTAPQPWQGAPLGGQFLIDGVAAAVSQFSIDHGQSPSYIDDANSPGAIFGAVIPERAITGSMNPIATSVATRDLFSKFRTGATVVLLIKLGSTPGNIFTINATVAIMGEPRAVDNGVIRWNYPFEVLAGTLTYVFT